MATLAITVEQVGAPLGTLALTATAQAVTAALVNRLNALVELCAYDGSGNAVSFLWSTAAAGTFNRAQPGSLRLPFVDGQSYFFKEDVVLAPTLQANCAG